MRVRGTAIALAFLLAVGATGAVFLYVRSVQRQAGGGAQHMVTVIVPKEDLRAGTSMDQVIKSGGLTTLQIPSDAVVQGAVTDLSQLQGKVTSAFILQGEQITTARLQGTSQPTGGRWNIPSGFQAVTISLDAERVVNGLQPQDHVVVYATVDAGDRSVTLPIVPDAQVLAVFGSNGSVLQTGGSGAGSQIVMLALRPRDAEAVILAKEKENVWLSLLPPSERGVPEPPLSTSDLGK
jgi:Flp pilus assembly protein CpaB